MTIESRKLSVGRESWPIAGSFTISRGSKTAADVVIAEIAAGEVRGRGECVPYARYGESPASVEAQIREISAAIEGGMGRGDLQGAMAPGAARNALDCALWDLEAKQSGKPAYVLAGLPDLFPLTTAYTLSLGTPEEMGKAAANAAQRPLIKIKLGQDGDAERLRAVRASAPASRLIVDANEGWSRDVCERMFEVCQETGVELVEQPLPAGEDRSLSDIARPVPVCADESAHDRNGLEQLAGRYDAINIKLDKTGGLTEALALADAAQRLNLDIMVGCMLATSLAMAPAMLVAQQAGVVDLDGPLLLARDREHGIRFDGSLMHPPARELWG